MQNIHAGSSFLPPLIYHIEIIFWLKKTPNNNAKQKTHHTVYLSAVKIKPVLYTQQCN